MIRRAPPFDYYPDKQADWQSVLQTYDRIYAWLGYWRDKMPSEAVSGLQDILGPIDFHATDE